MSLLHIVGGPLRPRILPVTAKLNILVPPAISSDLVTVSGRFVITGAVFTSGKMPVEIYNYGPR